MGSFDKIARDMFEGSVERKKDEGRVDVCEHENNGEGTVQEETDGFVGDVKILQEAVEHSFGTEDGLPGIAADEIADPQGNDDELVEKVLANAGVERHEIRDGVAEQQRKQSYSGGDTHGAEKNLRVDGLLKKFGVVL